MSVDFLHFSRLKIPRLVRPFLPQFVAAFYDDFNFGILYRRRLMTCWRYGVKILNFNLVSLKFWPEAVRGNNYSSYDCGMKSKILIQGYSDSGSIRVNNGPKKSRNFGYN